MSTIRYTDAGNYNPGTDDAATFLPGPPFIPLTLAPDGFGNFVLTGGPPSAVLKSDGSALTVSDGIFADFSDALGTVSLTGGNVGDVLRGGLGLDTLNGGGGNDVLEGGVGGDSLDGGAGVNTLSYEHSATGVSVGIGIGGGGSGFSGDAAGDTFLNFQNIRGSASVDTLSGSLDLARNVLEGGGGGDSLIGGFSDVASYEHSGVGVTVDLRLGGSSQGGLGDAAGDQLIGIQNLRGSANADSLTGSDFANILEGFGGADSLYGGGGNDRLIVTDTPAMVDGGADKDTLILRGRDSFTFTDANFLGIETVTVEDGSDANFSGVSAGIVFTSRSASLGVTIVGSDGNDRITAGAAGDDVTGGGGADLIFGGAGGDTIRYVEGGFGRDVLYRLDAETDQIDLSGVADSLSDLKIVNGANGAGMAVTIKGGTPGDQIVIKGVTLADLNDNPDFFLFS